MSHTTNAAVADTTRTVVKLTLKLKGKGRSRKDVIKALHATIEQIKEGNTWGFLQNEEGSFDIDIGE